MQYQTPNRSDMDLGELMDELKEIYSSGFMRLHAKDRESNAIKREVESRGYALMIGDEESDFNFGLFPLPIDYNIEVADEVVGWKR